MTGSRGVRPICGRDGRVVRSINTIATISASGVTMKTTNATSGWNPVSLRAAVRISSRPIVPATASARSAGQCRQASRSVSPMRPMQSRQARTKGPGGRAGSGPKLVAVWLPVGVIRSVLLTVDQATGHRTIRVVTVVPRPLSGAAAAPSLVTRLREVAGGRTGLEPARGRPSGQRLNLGDAGRRARVGLRDGGDPDHAAVRSAGVVAGALGQHALVVNRGERLRRGQHAGPGEVAVLERLLQC